MAVLRHIHWALFKFILLSLLVYNGVIIQNESALYIWITPLVFKGRLNLYYFFRFQNNRSRKLPSKAIGNSTDTKRNEIPTVYKWTLPNSFLVFYLILELKERRSSTWVKFSNTQCTIRKKNQLSVNARRLASGTVVNGRYD